MLCIISLYINILFKLTICLYICIYLCIFVYLCVSLCTFLYICVYFCIFALIFKRCAARFATKWTSRELLGRPVARYSAVFVFKSKAKKSMNLHGNIQKQTKNTQPIARQGLFSAESFIAAAKSLDPHFRSNRGAADFCRFLQTFRYSAVFWF